MNIVLFNETSLTHVDGVTVSGVNLLRGLSELGHKVMAVVPGPASESQIEISGLELVDLPSVPTVVFPDTRMGFFHPKVYEKMKKFDADVVVLANPGVVGMSGILMSRTFNIPALSVFHGYFMEPEYLRILGIKRGAGQISKVLWRYAKFFFDSSDVVVTPSRFVRQDMINHGFEKRIEVVKNPIYFGSKKKNIKVDRKVLRSDRRLLYVGRLSVEKNLEMLLEVFASVNKKVSGSELVIVGDGPIKKELERKAKMLGVSNKVKMMGRLDHDMLLESEVFLKASVFVSCSVTEVQPMSFLEAMYFGLPLVVTDVRGSGELVEGNGYAVGDVEVESFSKKIVELLENKLLRVSMGKKSQELAREHECAKVAQEYVRLMSGLVKTKKA